ncbi:glycoside hydrolase family 3 C-terminal domain-containing protein [Streptomyces sp. NPDC001568]|uniref:glycoside hydrolase family 3 C-terminal domain-containing protein n=1 Tax=Streptomyces sp. NPDC001568 TaxID=3364588 RepID=UPI00367CA378
MSGSDAERLVDGLDLRRRVRLLTGSDTWRTSPEPAIGLAEMVFSDGPVGVRGPGWDETLPSALLPCPSALGALWDEERVHRLGRLLGDEARRKGVHVLLAPNLNLHRSPLAGRHFECFSEDPLLTGRIGAALIAGVQSRGVAAAAKHYVANDSETERLTLDARLDERVLRELYLPPFEAAVRAGVWLVMSAYNRVNGTTMSESSLLAEPLKGEWGFDGVVVSDWGAVRSTAASAVSAQDLAMPGPDGPWGEALAVAVEDGRVPAEAVADKVRRLLRLAARVGALREASLEGGGGGGATAGRAGPGADLDLPDASDADAPDTCDVPDADAPGSGTGVDGADRRRRLLRESAAASFVLLENRAGGLPLDAAGLGSLAVIGVHATEPRVQGGGSSEVFPVGVVTPLAGLREALPDRVRVVYEPGPRPAGAAEPGPLGARCARDPDTGLPGVRLRVLDAAGAVLHSQAQPSGRVLEPGLPPGAATVELEAVLHPDVTGPWTLGLGGFGQMTLHVDEVALIKGEFPPETDDPAVVHVRPPQHTARIRLEAGRPVRVVARRALAPGTGRATVLTAAPPEPDPVRARADALGAARAADAVVVCVGSGEGGESEGRDRDTLELDPSQGRFIGEIARANPRTIVVVNCGGPVVLPWRKDPAAVLLTWFPGQEGGAALADVLLGRAEPGGRLPTTWPDALADAPVRTTRPTRGVLPYEEGLHIGHRGWLRADRRPAYWFGHGLGYTTWEFERIGTPLPLPGGGYEVPVEVRNTGSRPGREVVQVHLARPGSALERPVRWLAGWAAVRAEPGERATARVRIPERALQHWSPPAGGWATEPGRFTLLAGRSAGDLPLRAALDA